MAVIIKIVALAIAVFVASYIIPGVEIENIQSLFVVSIILAVVNSFIKPILVVLTLPLTIITLGIFLLLLNGILIMLVSSIVPGFEVQTFLSAILFSIVVSLVSSLLSKVS
jgi:putative membrane protein